MKNKKILISLIASLSVVSCGVGDFFGLEGTPRSFPTPTISVKDERDVEK